jgi:hypothetical protein
MRPLRCCITACGCKTIALEGKAGLEIKAIIGVYDAAIISKDA